MQHQSEPTENDIGLIAIASHKHQKTKKKKVSNHTHSPSHHRPRRKRHRKTTRSSKQKHSPLWVFFLVTLLLIVCSFLGSFFYLPPLVKGVIATQIAKHIGQPVTIETVFFNPLNLTLRLHNITIGTETVAPSTLPLLHCDFVEFDLEAISVIKKGFICQRASVKGLNVQLVRNKDFSYNFSSLYTQIMGLSEHDSQEIPPRPALYYSINNITLDNSRITFIDSPAGKTHHVDKVHFSLPVVSNLPYQTGKYILPEFSAIINNSPINMTGKTRILKDNSTETRLELHLKDFDIAEYSEYLRILPDKTFLTGGTADGTVELRFSDGTGSGMKLTLRGAGKIHNLILQDEEKHSVLRVPDGQVDLTAEPLSHRYVFENIQLNQPEVSIAFDRQKQITLAGFPLRMNQKHTPEKINHAVSIQIDQLLLNQGIFTLLSSQAETATVTKTWKNVSLSLTGFPGTITTSQQGKNVQTTAYAVSGSSDSPAGTESFSVKGTVTDKNALEGTLEISDFNPASYQKYFFQKDDLHISQGKMTLKGQFQYSPHPTKQDQDETTGFPGLRLLNANATVHNLKVERRKQQILRTDSLSCNQLTLDFSTHTLACWSMEMQGGALFAGQLQQVKNTKNPWDIALSNISINGLTAHVPLLPPPGPGKQDKTLTFTKISLQAADLQKRQTNKNNIIFSAEIKPAGSIELTGRYSVLSGIGNLQTSIKNLDISFLKPYVSPWVIPEIQSGNLLARGDINLPSPRFTGMIWIENFSAGARGNQSLGWSQAFATGVSISLNPFHLGIDEIDVKTPFLNLTDPLKQETEQKSDKVSIHSFLHLPKHVSISSETTTINLSPVEIHTVSFENGTFTFPGDNFAQDHSFVVSRASGTVKDINKSASQEMTFTLRGVLEPSSDIIIRGIGGLDSGIHQSTMDITSFDMTPFTDSLKNDPGINFTGATATLSRQISHDGKAINQTNAIDFFGITFNDQGPFTDTIALLADAGGNFQLKLNETVPEQSAVVEYPLLERLRQKLQQDQIKASLSPFLLLEEHMNAPVPSQSILFSPGSDELTNTARQNLNDFQHLLEKRPYLQLIMTSGFDSAADGASIQKQVQHREDLKRQTNNARRAALRNTYIRKEKKRLIKSKAGSGKVDEKSILKSIPKQYQALPAVQVSVPNSMLESLALRRGANVITYLVQIGIDENRLLMDKEVDKNHAQIDFSFRTEGSQPASETVESSKN